MQPNKVGTKLFSFQFFFFLFSSHMLVTYLDQWAIFVQSDFVMQGVSVRAHKSKFSVTFGGGGGERGIQH